MKLNQNNFHKNFKLNGNSFSSVDEILNYTKVFSEEICQFLKTWYSASNSLTVKTSGSTGIPKEILLKKECIINSAEATGAYFNLKANTTALLCLPIEYIAGKMMLIRALTLGWQLDVVAANSEPLKKIYNAYDFCAMVPLQLENSIDSLNLIKKVIVGGGVVSKQLQQKIQSSTCSVFATYGMTETITHIAVKKLNNFNRNTSSTGLNSFYNVLPNIKIYKDDRNCLVINALQVSTTVIFTNDIVNLISDVHFEWLGRFDNVINSGGIKLHPETIEEKLSNIIASRFFVTGISDEKLGKKLILIVEGKPEKINLKNTSLSKFEIPKEIYFVDEFIETASAKIQQKKTLELVKFC